MKKEDSSSNLRATFSAAKSVAGNVYLGAVGFTMFTRPEIFLGLLFAGGVGASAYFAYQRSRESEAVATDAEYHKSPN